MVAGLSEGDPLPMDTGHERTLEAVARLAGGIAHDLNNALLPLRAYGEIALRRIARGEDAREEVEEMLAASERATALTRQLLAFSGRQVLRPEVVDLNALVRSLEVTDLVRDEIAIVRSLSAVPVHVNADPTLLDHVIVNLVLNARAAMPDGGTITIAVSKDGSRLGAELRVSDTGHGMDAETATRVFEPFFACDESARGLGLAAAHGIVTQSGGTISIETAPGAGTSMVIRLPLAGVDHRDEPAATRDDGYTRGATVLLVEDDDAVRASVERMLNSSGYGVVTAADGEEAVRLALTTAMDIVLTDVAMSGLNGREAAEQILSSKPDVPVVFMSGYTDDAVLRRGVGDRELRFLQKPFGIDELTRALDDALA